MLKRDRLRKEALESCSFRGHTMTLFEWVHHYHRPNRSLGDSYCIECNKWVQVDTCPPNGIDIGGPAVALGCNASVT